MVFLVSIFTVLLQKYQKQKAFESLKDSQGQTPQIYQSLACCFFQHFLIVLGNSISTFWLYFVLYLIHLLKMIKTFSVFLLFLAYFVLFQLLGFKICFQFFLFSNSFQIVSSMLLLCTLQIFIFRDFVPNFVPNLSLILKNHKYFRHTGNHGEKLYIPST